MKGLCGDLKDMKEISAKTGLARCRVQENARGKTPEEALSMFKAEMEAQGLEVRTVLGPDAARIETTVQGSKLTVRRDWEGEEPLRNLLEVYFLLSLEDLDEIMDGNVTFHGRNVSALSLSERLAILHGAVDGYEERRELRTSEFREGLKEAVERSGFKMDLEYSDPISLSGGNVDGCVQLDCMMRLTDLISDRIIWMGRNYVIEDDPDAARMRALRGVLESAGFFDILPQPDRGRRDPKPDGFSTPIDWSGEKYA